MRHIAEVALTVSLHSPNPDVIGLTLPEDRDAWVSCRMAVMPAGMSEAKYDLQRGVE
jgi:hypothetical protein